MKERQIKLVAGSLLHDIGKVIYRSGDGRNHSQSGYEFLKNDTALEDKDITDCVRYHHGKLLGQAQLSDNNLAYITYFADNVAAATDRRAYDAGDDGFDKAVPLDSIFNILNGNHGKLHHRHQLLDMDQDINYPTDEHGKMDPGFYQKVISNIEKHLKQFEYTEEYINSLLSLLEANLTYIPSSTSRRELADISLFDHVKLTAAIAACVQTYMESIGESNYKETLFTKADDSYKQKMFLLFSMDISGIQNFIYTISSKGALKMLRARSFYLEIVMEHMIDELLRELGLSRTNLIYAGGGHCYMLLANTAAHAAAVERFEKNMNRWFMENYGTALYVAAGYTPCSAGDLQNKPSGSYSQLYVQLSGLLSEKKAHRYSAKDILWLNHQSHEGERECNICHRMSHVDADDRCEVCSSLYRMSEKILHQSYFVVTEENLESDPEKQLFSVPLPGDRWLSAVTRDELMELMESGTYVRSYTKNKLFIGKHVATKLWVGDYTTDDSFEDFANEAEGINRIGVLRADVDNLGKTIVFGFYGKNGDDKYVTLSRSATLSRQLSLFFKCYINKILSDGQCMSLKGNKRRKVTIVYSGGDDLFLVGAWNDVLEAFVDLKKALDRFTEGTLTVSGGVGLYQESYPVNILAKEVEGLEDCAKSMPEKDSIAIFDRTNTYKWSVFENEVLKDKFEEIRKFFDLNAGYGKAFLYHILELLRVEPGERFNKARYIYMLSRMEPDRSADATLKYAYKEFSKHMYEWASEEESRRMLITAIYLYVYMTREEDEDDNRRE